MKKSKSNVSVSSNTVTELSLEAKFKDTFCQALHGVF